MDYLFTLCRKKKLQTTKNLLLLLIRGNMFTPLTKSRSSISVFCYFPILIHLPKKQLDPNSKWTHTHTQIWSIQPICFCKPYLLSLVVKFSFPLVLLYSWMSLGWVFKKNTKTKTLFKISVLSSLPSITIFCSWFFFACPTLFYRCSCHSFHQTLTNCRLCSSVLSFPSLSLS